MGFYLNSQASYTLYQNEAVLANMVTSFFSKACDAKELFSHLAIAKEAECEIYRNKYNVVHISFNDMPRNCNSYLQYMNRIEERLKRDLQKEFPDVSFEEKDAVWDDFLVLYMEHPKVQFLFVMDEWDFIFHQDFATEADRRSYLLFLRNLLKDRPYVRLAYMTGILPISKYSSGSELNMFTEYTMAKNRMFSECFGFSDSEVDMLYERYCKMQEEPLFVEREGLRLWYDGYATQSGKRLYNPRSVVLALSNNSLGNYWTSSGPYDEIFYYLRNNVDAVRDALALMVSGASVPTRIQEYAAVSRNLKTKEEIFSAMVVYYNVPYKVDTAS